ncbi:universal stress protein [Maribacter aestuarii]|uniref:universal stress protein n=1 Tax=Maribacter aestuarii TaxID=1130723 RepID=UPI00248C409D|nr:universal stress protein [Maribacter aestuarii]
MKTILCATDYSENSVAALKYAQKLSELVSAHLVVTHVFGFPIIIDGGFAEQMPDIRKENLKTHREKLEDFCKQHLGEQWKSMNIKIAPVEDLAILDGILGVAADWQADLIVAGAQGESALQDVLLGTTTKRLIKKAACPVLAIPSEAVFIAPKIIVYATDFEQEDVYAIQKTVELAERFKSKIKIVHISTKNEYAGETQMEWFQNSLSEKVTYEHLEFKLFFSEDIFKSLRDYLEEAHADLVVMLEREKHGFLKKIFHRDLVKKMHSYGEIPLLSFNEVNLDVLDLSLR